MITYYICLILWTLFFGITEGLETLERSAPAAKAKKLNATWHNTQIFQRLFGLLTGYFFYSVFGSGSIALQGVMFFNLIILHWILSDGVQNIIKKKNFFYCSPTSTAITEKIAGFMPKLFLLVLSISGIILV